MQERKEKRIDLLLKNAGLNRDLVAIGNLDEDFEIILQGLSDIHKGKQVGYGDYQDEHMGEDDITKAIYHFADIRRKYIRAKNMLKMMSKTDGFVDFAALLDTYTDLAVYSVMGIQMLFDIIERKDQTPPPVPPKDYFPSEKARIEKGIMGSFSVPANTLQYTPVTPNLLKAEG